METIPDTQGDSSGMNPSNVKSNDNSPQHRSGRDSPPPNCAICLGICRNKSFTDSCLHQFCFKCLLTWSKVKAECPLCKQNFKSIIHNVQDNQQYEEYLVGQQDAAPPQSIDIDTLTSTRRFRYRTTLTLPRRDTIAIQQLLLRYPMVLPAPRRRRSPASFRRTVYRHNLWARPLPDFTGRFRDCTPDFYRFNDTQSHRLVPWLHRELSYLLHENTSHISYVMAKIIESLPQYHITSLEFREVMQRYFGDRTEHFLHELYCFASTPYDMTGYDRNVQYTTDSRISTMANEVISSSDSEVSVDSDIVMVSSSEPANAPIPTAGPSGVIAPQPATNVIPIETISQSDTDDDSSEVIVVGYIKPPQERTPEVVDLAGSDSDVIVHDTARPEPVQNNDTSDNNLETAVVKLTLKRHGSQENSRSDSEGSAYRVPARRRRRHRSGESVTPPFTTTSYAPTSTSTSSILSPLRTSTTATSSSSWSSSSTSTSSSSSSSSSNTDSSSSDYRKKRVIRKKSMNKINKEKRSSKSERKRSDKRGKRPCRPHKTSTVDQAVTRRLVPCKRKSHSGKGVKCTKKNEESVDNSVPSTSNQDRHRSSREVNCRSNRENRRLKSIVRVPSTYRNRSEPSSSTSNGNVAPPHSDSEDDLPLNLTVNKPHSLN